MATTNTTDSTSASGGGSTGSTAKRSTAKRSTAKRSSATPPARKSTTRKSTTRKSTARKSTAKKATAKKATAIPASQMPAMQGEAAKPADEHVHEAIVHIKAARTGEGRKDPRFLGGRLFKRAGIQWVRNYHRLEVRGDLPKLGGPTMFVTNHGFGGITDLNAFAVWAVEQDLKLDRPLVALGHGMAWKVGGGEFFEGFGGVPASSHAAEDAFADGCHVLVIPGGDIEAAKTFSERNKVIFSGRSGFARVAMKAGVPILPVVTAGAGETLYCISRGETLAKVTGASRVLRLKALAVSISVPMGLTVGGPPYLPLPAKLVTTVLPLMTPNDGETADQLASRVHTEMQSAMDDMTRDRRFLLG